jgi:hypothetical protein
MAYDHFGAPIKSTEVALALYGEPVESRESFGSLEPRPMRPETAFSAARVASSNARDPMLAATRLASQLGHENLGCVLFFCSAEYNLERLSIALRHVFQGVLVCGCTSAGEITPDGYGRGCITAIGFDSRYFTIDCALIREVDRFQLQDAQEVIDGLLSTCRDANVAPIKGNTFAITLLDGLSSREELVLATLNSALGTIPQFGGSAGDDEKLANTHVYYNGQFHTGAATVLLVNTTLDFRVFSTHHMVAEEEKLVVTRADAQSRSVYELNAEPAADAYARAVGMSVDELNREVFALRPLGVRIGGHYFVRSVQRVNRDGSMTFYCAVETGIVMTSMSPESLLQTLHKPPGSANCGPRIRERPPPDHSRCPYPSCRVRIYPQA